MLTIVLWLGVAVASLLTFVWWSGDDLGAPPLVYAVPAAWIAVFVVAAVRKLWRKMIAIAMTLVAVNGAGVIGIPDVVRDAVNGDAGADVVRID